MNFDRILALISIAFAVWQYRKQRELSKIVNDKVKRLYNDSKAILELTKKGKSLERIGERARAIIADVIQLDILNNNLNSRKIDELGSKGILNEKRVSEYKHYSSN